MRQPLGTRAVSRQLRPAMDPDPPPCAHCTERVVWSPRRREQRIIANVYDGDRWLRVEHFHPGCYDAAGQPYGTPTR